MMLEWLEEALVAREIRRAVEEALAAGAGTQDLGGKLSIREITDRVIERVASAQPDCESRGSTRDLKRRARATWPPIGFVQLA